MTMKFSLIWLVSLRFAGNCFVHVQASEEDRKLQYVECPTHADPNDCPVPNYFPCGDGELSCDTKGKKRRALTLTPTQEEARRLQLALPATQQFEIPDDSTKLPYDKPCYSPTRNDLKNSWTLWEKDDDESVNVPLGFPFEFYGETYDDVFVSDNGFLSFHNTFRNNYQPTSFPSGLGTPMIAPFWADIEVARNGGQGNIYYRDFGEVFAVIWDEVGYFQDGNTNPARPGAHNSFQVVISKSTNERLPDLSNVCFCYLDMGFSHGDRDGVDGFGVHADATSGIRAATIGITKGLDDPFGTTTYAQIGRFNETGNTHRGISTASGVDWLDFMGSDGPNQVNQRAGFCFNGRPNLPPVFKAGPFNGMLSIPCGGNLNEYKVYFGTPEMEQTVKLVSIPQQPTPTPEGLEVTFDGGGFASDTLGIRFEWLSVDFSKYGGRSFVYEFEVCDDHQQNPLCIKASVSIHVATCANGQGTCSPDYDKCIEIADSQCTREITVGDIARPVCTPNRSPEQCDPLFSFPTLISARYPMIRESLRGSQGDLLGDAGYWFHYTDDRAGAYSFTRSSGIDAPNLHCCVTTVDELLGSSSDPDSSLCFGSDSTGWNDAFVIRAEGHHSGQGVFVLPEGLDSVGGSSRAELGAGVGPVTLNEVRGYLSSLTPSPKKFVVEQFIGSGSGASATLPTEYKFHMFNGRIGSISLFKNRGTSCQCFGEYSADWECLHANGCFRPSLPMGVLNLEDSQCYNIDFEKGRINAFPVKGFDLCGEVDKPSNCLLSQMKDIAVELSLKIGVYVRIDMFVTENQEIYVQEYTFNHLGGTRHCASRTTESGCIDSCFLGKLWQDAGGNGDVGGPLTDVPTVFSGGYGAMTDAEQCAIATSQKPLYVPRNDCFEQR